MPTMFCSATPTLMKRSGKRSANGSTTMKPRSPVSRSTRGSLSASSTSAVTNAFLMRDPAASTAPSSASAVAYWSSSIGR